MSVTRRAFFKGSVASGVCLTLGFSLTNKTLAQNPNADNKGFQPNSYIRITEDNQVSLLVTQAEMGQGVFTVLPMILAEELDADWQTINIEHIKLPNSDFEWIGTGGSSSVIAGYHSLRVAGASARSMLLQAAAEHWKVDISKLSTKDNHVINSSNSKRIPYGDLVAKAAKLPAPKQPKLKSTESFKLIGKDIKRVESPEKVTGKAQFGIDTQLPNMRYAVVARPPIFGAKFKSFDDSKTKKIKGFIKAKVVPSGVAIIADSFWQAKKAREQISIDWDLGNWKKQSTEKLKQEYKEQTKKGGNDAMTQGDPKSAKSKAATVLEMFYELPFLAHAPMEPENCVVHDKSDSAEIWTGTQMQGFAHGNSAQILGHKPDKVTLHNHFIGGGFGRRLSTDFIDEACHVAKDESWPIKTVWTREDDITGGIYRPMVTHKTTLGLNEKGMPSVFENTAVGSSSVGDLYYDIPNSKFDESYPNSPVSMGAWRSVSHSHIGFVIESAIDEAASAAKADPLDYRRTLLKNKPRMITALDKIKQMSSWSKKRQSNTGLGLAIHPSFGSIVAQVAQVKVEKDNITVEKVWCVVDCGFAVNPLNVKAQMESGIIYGLSAALFGEITFSDGKVQQSNFHNYPVVRMNQSPDIDVEIINSGAHMGGIGEPGLPPIAPAVANAIFATTGKRLRSLPLKV